MRLSLKEQEILKQAFRICLSDFSFQLYLFGSRTDDRKKGGDIDLLLLVPSQHKEFAVNLKNKIRIKIFEKMPEQKIDITVATAEETASDPFLQSVADKAVLLLEYRPSKQ